MSRRAELLARQGRLIVILTGLRVIAGSLRRHITLQGSVGARRCSRIVGRPASSPLPKASKWRLRLSMPVRLPRIPMGSRLSLTVVSALKMIEVMWPRTRCQSRALTSSSSHYYVPRLQPHSALSYRRAGTSDPRSFTNCALHRGSIACCRSNLFKKVRLSLHTHRKFH